MVEKNTLTLVTAICVLLFALFLIVSAFASMKSLRGAGAIIETIVEVLWLVGLGSLGVYASQRKRSVAAIAYTVGLVVTALVALVMMIIIFAASDAVEAEVHALCAQRNLDEHQCSIMLRITRVTAVLMPAGIAAYCACYAGIAGLYARELRRSYRRLDTALGSDDFGDYDHDAIGVSAADDADENAGDVPQFDKTRLEAVL